MTCFPKRDAQHHLGRPGLKAVLYSLRCDGVIVMRPVAQEAADELAVEEAANEPAVEEAEDMRDEDA